MRNSLKGRLKSRFFIYFLVVSITLGFVFSIPYLPLVSAQFTPDNGFYEATKMQNFSLYSSGTAYKSGANTVSWLTMWTGNIASYVDTSRYSGWEMTTTQKINKRAILWFDTLALRDDLTITKAYITITSTYFGSAADKANFYLCGFADQSPPITTADYIKTNCLNTTGFDGNSSARKISFPVSSINKVGYSTFQIVGWADMLLQDLGSQGSSDKCYIYIASSSCKLTIEYDVTPPHLTAAYPINGISVGANPYLSATVKGYGMDISGYARIYESVGGVWTLRNNVTVNGNEQVVLGWQSAAAATAGTYTWRVACRLIGYPLLWHNYTFTYVVVITPVPSGLKVSIDNKKASYQQGTEIIFRSNVPMSIFTDHPTGMFMWVTDPQNNILNLWPGPYSVFRPVWELATPVTLNLLSTSTAGVYKIHLSNVNRATGEAGDHTVEATFNVTLVAAGYSVVPEKYVFSSDEPVRFNVFTPDVYRQYYAWLVYASNFTLAKNSKGDPCNVSFIRLFGGIAYYNGMFLYVNPGTYRLQLYNYTSRLMVNYSRNFQVISAATLNVYTITMSKRTYVVGDYVTFDVSRGSGVHDYWVRITAPNGDIVYEKSRSSSPVTIQGFSSAVGRYVIDVWDYDKSPGSTSSETDYYDVTTTGGGGEQNDDWGSYFTGLSPYLGIAVFGILLGLGFFVAVKLHTPMAFPVTLFGGIMMCSIPNTPISVFPAVFIFVMGLALLLILLLVMKRG